MTNQRSRDERLRDILSTAAGICYGMDAYDERLVEFGSGFPAGSGGGGSKGAVSRPVERMALEAWEDSLKPKHERKGDPASKAQADFDKRLEAAHHAMEALWGEYARICQPRAGVEKIKDPGCELCAMVPDNCERCTSSDMVDHWCPTHCTVDVTVVSKRKSEPDTTVKRRLCSNCYDFRRRAGRLPSHDEVLDHVEGRRRRWKVGA